MSLLISKGIKPQHLIQCTSSNNTPISYFLPVTASLLYLNGIQWKCFIFSLLQANVVLLVAQLYTCAFSYNVLSCVPFQHATARPTLSMHFNSSLIGNSHSWIFVFVWLMDRSILLCFQSSHSTFFIKFHRNRFFLHINIWSSLTCRLRWDTANDNVCLDSCFCSVAGILSSEPFFICSFETSRFCHSSAWRSSLSDRFVLVSNPHKSSSPNCPNSLATFSPSINKLTYFPLFKSEKAWRDWVRIPGLEASSLHSLPSRCRTGSDVTLESAIAIAL